MGTFAQESIKINLVDFENLKLCKGMEMERKKAINNSLRELHIPKVGGWAGSSIPSIKSQLNEIGANSSKPSQTSIKIQRKQAFPSTYQYNNFVLSKHQLDKEYAEGNEAG